MKRPRDTVINIPPYEIDPSTIRHLASPLASATNPCMSYPEHTEQHAIRLPHPADVAARKALEQRPPAPLERVLEQAAVSRKCIAEWRAKGLPDLHRSLRPPILR